MRDLEDLKINNGGRPFACEAVKQEWLDDFQNHFAVELPREYVALLLHANGGAPELNTIYPVEQSNVGEWSVNRFYYLDNNKTRGENLWAETKHWSRFLGPSAIPFADNGLGDQFFLDLNLSPPVVKVCIHDEKNRIIEIAPSFENFIDRLEVGRDMI